MAQREKLIITTELLSPHLFVSLLLINGFHTQTWQVERGIPAQNAEQRPYADVVLLYHD